MPAPAYKLTRYFIINSVLYWEHNLPPIRDKPGYFLFDNRAVTIQEITNLASRWETGINFGPFGWNNFAKSEIQNAIYQLHKTGDPEYRIGKTSFTAEKLREFADYIESETTGRDGEKEKEPVMDIELAGDGHLKKIVDNLEAKLEAKLEAVRRYRKVCSEVALMRKSLAKKEEELKECERIIQLESEQV
ncbi:uncharacterized protein LAJ45_03398 [Morchella importuna]|uniref:uncharacterized protein n=1 Tax=Morchella importuna TaxID=1174673 RepID=UPI001E8E4D29|nr:uncharacterized protein LAJ45_03398 [Morchella importuna]KAH8152558.1 hypothetical protein LAJ45_03398 [Morchella importuna]